MTIGRNIVENMGPGQPLDASTQAFFEPRFGRGFGNVRVHSDARAAESARSLDASAYTLGGDIVFGAGRYAPGSADGRRLLAHELTHVAQQQSSSPGIVQRQETGAGLAPPTPGWGMVYIDESTLLNAIRNSPGQESGAGLSPPTPGWGMVYIDESTLLKSLSDYPVQETGAGLSPPTPIPPDSYSHIAASNSQGIRTTVPMFLSLSAGAAVSSRGASTWYARVYEGVEFRHPVLGIFNPTLGTAFSLIGETESGTPAASLGPTNLMSLLGGVRIGDPRPGAAGGGYVSLFGGPAIAVRLGGPRARGVGAEAGMAIGYRWRWLDFSAGAGYTYDPTRALGKGHLYTLTAEVSFIPLSTSIPGSH